MIVPVVELGLLLQACESVPRFDKVLRRLVGGERSAYSELALGATLLRLGHSAVEFEPAVGEGELDARCLVDGVPVYFEVVAPESSDASATEQQLVNQLTAKVRARVSKCRVEIEIRARVDVAAVERIVTAVQAAEPFVWTAVDPVARVRRIDLGQSLLPLFDGGGAQVVVGRERTLQGESTSVVARWETSDARAKRVFNDEYHHFNKEVANVLVVNVSAISDGMEEWSKQIADLLQPGRNRKVGAVAFFEQRYVFASPEAIRRRWRILVNTHAHVQISEALLNSLESMDDSSFYGLTRPKRLIAE